MFASALGDDLVGCVEDGCRACHQVAEPKGGVTQEVAAHHKESACKRNDQSKSKHAAQFFAKDKQRHQCNPQGGRVAEQGGIGGGCIFQ